MLVFPNAKINLGLRVIRRRHDGYHDLESFIYPLDLQDVLEILPVSGNDPPFLKTSGLKVPDDHRNLCYKALEILRSRHVFPEVGIYLHKVIPWGAGLGGGSADGSFTMRAVNDLFGLCLSRQKLLEYAGRLGSDCPFFIVNTPCLVTGRGDTLSTEDSCLKGYHLLLVVPGLKIDTSRAYRMVSPRSEGHSVSEIIRMPPGDWQGRLVNDFEEPLFSEYPELRAIRDRLYGSGAIYASMTGSGSGIYGIFESQPEIPSDFERCFVHCEKMA